MLSVALLLVASAISHTRALIITVDTRCSAAGLVASQPEIVDGFIVRADALPRTQLWEMDFFAPRRQLAAVVEGEFLPFTVLVEINRERAQVEIIQTATVTQLVINSLNENDVQPITFAVQLTTPYARSPELPCAGIKGASIISEFILREVSPIPDDGEFPRGECIHVQPIECVNGGPVVGLATDQSWIALIAWSAVALVIVFAVIAVGAR